MEYSVGSLGSFRQVDDVLHLRHHRNLIGPARQIGALAGRAHMVAVEVSCSLLEFGEVLDRPQRPLRAMNLLIVETAQAGGVEPETSRLRSDIGSEVKGAVGMKVRVAIETGHAV